MQSSYHALVQARLPSKAELPGELWGGFAAMLVALPSAIAYGITIHAIFGPEYVAQGAVAGVVGAIALGLVAPIFGGSQRLVTAPCAPAAAVIAAFTAGLVTEGGMRGDPELNSKILGMMALVGLFSGLLQLVYGLAGGGRLIKYIPYPVVSGYLSGVGFLIVASQLPKLLGLPKDISLWQGLIDPTVWKLPAVLTGLGTIVGMLLAPRVTKAVPPAIIGVASGILVYFGLGFAMPHLWALEGNKLVIGTFASSGGLMQGFHNQITGIGRLTPHDLGQLLVPALTLSVLLSIDTLKTCVVIDSQTRSRHDSNRELIGQGLGNMVSAAFGGMPGAGTMGATLVNVSSGGRTWFSSWMVGWFILVVFLLLSRLIVWVPVAALSGVLIVVAFRMVDKSSIQLLKHRTTMLDFLVILAVAITGLTYSLIGAAGVGLALAILLFIREQIRGSVIRRKVHGDQVSSKRQRLPDEKECLLEKGRQITICELQGSLFFGTTDQLFTELESDLKTCKHLILDLRRIQSVDFTAAHMLVMIEATLADRGGTLLLANISSRAGSQTPLTNYFREVGLLKTGSVVQLFDTLDAALEWAEDRVLEAEHLVRGASENLLKLDEIELLRELSTDGVLREVAGCAVNKSFAAGETIFKHGEVGDELFLIRRGFVRILLELEGGRSHNLATFAQGNFFGEMAFLDKSVRSADAVALTATDLYVISRRDFDKLSRSHLLMGVKIFARLARAVSLRLRHTDNELRALQES